MEPFQKNITVEEPAPYILTFPFLTPEFCSYILKVCKNNNSWNPNKDDKLYRTQDINFDEAFPSLFKTISTGFMQKIAPIVSKKFFTEVEDPYSIFALKYCKEGQTMLPVHRDDSYISASIKLNNDYEGGELIFPEHGFSNINTAIGDIIVWPGSITHPHGSYYLTEGEKYSITIWTPYPEIGT